jgi:hypothetical protein
MSSMFEAPPSPRRGSWLKVATAFVAGAVVAVAIGRVPTILYGSPQPSASSRVPAAGLRPPTSAPPIASKPPAPELSKPLADARENPPPAAEARDGQAQGATASTAAAAGGAVEGKSCTWPYVDQRCNEPDSNSGQATQSVRVIPTDRSAPPTIATTSAPSAPAEPKPVANVATAGPSPAPPAAVAPVAPAPAAPAAVAASPGQPGVPPGAAEQASNEPDSRVREPTRAKEPKATGPAKKEARRPKPSQQQSRTARSRGIEERGDAVPRRAELADSTVVETHVLSDGRQVTVHRRFNARDDARTSARDDRVRRIPLPLSAADDDDDDD